VPVLKARGVVAGLVLAAVAARAQPDAPPAGSAPTEYEVKAAFLYNFARFVEWPPESFRDPQEPFVIAILGRDPFGPVLDGTVAGKQVAGRPIAVKRAGHVDEVRDAQIVFVCASERPNMAAILKGLDRPGVLTLGDTEGFAE
jgi:hypothetical protein